MRLEGELLEIRVHGRGGQGGVTCAKLIAAVYAEMGRYVQTFGDYGSERSGAPVRAFARVDAAPIRHRNKVYRPDHLIVFDRGLLGADVLDGARAGGLLLVNTPEGPESLGADTGFLTAATVDATGIARRRGIGTHAVVIINTTIVGAYVKLLDLPWEALEAAYHHLGLTRDLPAAREAFDAVRSRPPVPGAQPPPLRAVAPAPVLPLTQYLVPVPSALKTGGWRSQSPSFAPGLPPCGEACPAGNDVEAVLRALETQGEAAAAEALLRTQPLPSVCGRVCPGFCMRACNRAAYDGAVNIRALERWVGDHAGPLPAAAPASGLRVAVVGAGPAGLSAAWALAREGCRVTLLEKEDAPGGVLRHGIPAYRLPPEALERDLDRLASPDVELRCGEAVDAGRIAELAASHDAVLLAVGFGAPRRLGVPGEDLPGVVQGLDFLAEVKRGTAQAVSGRVLVAGGGNTAVDCARAALRLGASSVVVAYRRGRGEMGASEEEFTQAREEGVVFQFHRTPVALERAGGEVSAALAEVEPGPPDTSGDASGRAAPVVTSRVSRVPCDRVLLALGQERAALSPGWTLSAGRVREGGNVKNIWAAGDCSTAQGTVAHAIGDGRRTALALLAALRGRPAESPAPRPEAVAPERMRFDHFISTEPAREEVLPPETRSRAFAEVNRGLTGPQEAARCLHCGRCTACDTCLLYCPEGVVRRVGEGYDFEDDYCKGCGICAAQCPRGALSMRPLAGAGG